MSADAWRVCPKCGRDAAVNKRAAALAEAERAYGKMPAKEWKELFEKANAISETQPEETFREDYGIFMDSDGMFFVTYSGSCSNCTFKHNFNYEKQVLKK